MSTSATFFFDDPGNGSGVSFYTHADGDPEGVAEMFQAAEAYEDQAFSKFVDVFFRANPYLRFSEGHGAHLDTTHQYTYNHIDPYGERQDRLTVWKINRNGPNGLAFSGSLEEFIEEFAH